MKEKPQEGNAVNLEAGNFRLWLFRCLVTVTAGLMILSFSMPWWTTAKMDIGGDTEMYLPDAIRIFGYGLRHSLVEFRSYMMADETPSYQTKIAWVYLGISAGLVLISAWLNGKKGRFILGGTGLIYISYAAIAAFVVIAGRLGDFGFSLQGRSYYHAANAIVTIDAGLRFGFYLACVTGGMCIVLALLRNKIVVKQK
jgi:hypothetical protein